MKKRFFQLFAVMVVAVSATALLTSSELIKKGK